MTTSRCITTVHAYSYTPAHPTDLNTPPAIAMPPWVDLWSDTAEASTVVDHYGARLE
jgi:hypothetical protein